ncbi:ATP-grasp domain-containing protein [Haloferax namakaokahaiae]|uniref:ATP-grasp domain-containing protein n=1 Tax=Haloferax namakaokahaiae TaxID=1748331 RepID=A0ABD5ZJL9_9EURY
MVANRVLVLDTNLRQGIVTLRNLGRHGIEVTAGATTKLNPGAYSKYATHSIRYPSPDGDATAFADAIEAELRERDYDMVVGLGNATIPALTKHRDRFERYTAVPYPPHDLLMVGFDKWYSYQAACDAGIPVPKTVLPDAIEFDDVEAEVGYPVVLKPRRSHSRHGVVVCHSQAELEAAYRNRDQSLGSYLVQEYIPSEGEMGVYTLYDWSSNLVGLTVQRRLRTNPPEGGISTLRETIVHPEAVQYAKQLLGSIDWVGAGMIEYRIDSRDGVPKMLEFNPRFWGSMALSVFAGVEFPYLLYQLVTTGTCDAQKSYRVGVQAQHFAGEVGQLLSRPDKLTAARELLRRPDSPRTYDVLSRDDPLAAVAYVALNVQQLTTPLTERLLRRIRFRRSRRMKPVVDMVGRLR